MASRARCASRDVVARRRRDQGHPSDWVLWQTRTQAVLEARHAVSQDEYGAAYALRQAMIDLAACCEQMASRLPVPSVAAAA